VTSTDPKRFPPLELHFPDSPELAPVRIVHGDVRTIGRATECSICINNASVSREHAIVRYDDDGASIEDRNSRHGTKVGSVKLEPGMRLPIGEGDTILCGPVRIDVDRVYERVRTENLGGSPQDVRTVMLGARRGGGPQLIRVLRELTRIRPEEGGREVTAQAILRQLLAATGLERALLVRGASDSPDGRVSVIARVGEASGAISSTVLAAAKDKDRVAHLSQSQQLGNAQSIIGSGVSETVCARVPLNSGEELYIYLDSRRGQGSVSDDAAEFVGVAAAVCGLVFDGIEHRKLSEMRSHFERAANVQQKLLPSRMGTSGALAWALESVPAEPPDEANLGSGRPSGDIVGVAVRPDGSTLTWIGDVCGHGIGAALLMSAAQSWLHAAAGRVEDPAVTLTALNEFLHHHTEAHDFASLLVAAIAEDGSVEICDAGHGHAFRIGPGGPAYIEVPSESGGAVVGAMPDATYATYRIRLAAGERLVLATDGVRESTNAAGEQFGTDRVLEALRGSRSAEDDLARLRAAVEAFSGGVRHDDRTILSIERS